MSLYPNPEFVELHRRGGNVQAILPFEHELILHHLGAVLVRQQDERNERIEVREQSGDNWHDGAFNDLDREHRRIMQDERKLRSAAEYLQVDYPDEEQEEVTIGSRVMLSQGATEREIYLVGFGLIHNRNNKPSPVSVESPIGQLLVGQKVGAVATLRSLKPAMRDIKVLSLDQTFRPF